MRRKADSAGSRTESVRGERRHQHSWLGSVLVSRPGAPAGGCVTCAATTSTTATRGARAASPCCSFTAFPPPLWTGRRMARTHRAISRPRTRSDRLRLLGQAARFAYSIAAQADLFGALLRARGGHALRLIAHDYGLTVAQELLARAEGATAPPAITRCACSTAACSPRHTGRVSCRACSLRGPDR